MKSFDKCHLRQQVKNLYLKNITKLMFITYFNKHPCVNYEMLCIDS